MKARSFKKFFVSIALSAVLTLSSASSVFAATAQLVPAEQSGPQILSRGSRGRDGALHQRVDCRTKDPDAAYGSGFKKP